METASTKPEEIQKECKRIQERIDDLESLKERVVKSVDDFRADLKVLQEKCKHPGFPGKLYLKTTWVCPICGWHESPFLWGNRD